MQRNEAIGTVWNYLSLRHVLQPADLILCLGSNDIRPAYYATELWQKGLAPYLMFTGDGTQHETEMLNNPFAGKTEAETYFEFAREAGIPEEKLILETKANNTSDNFTFSEKILVGKNISVNKVIVVTKTYMSRRAYATGKIQWPNVELIMTAPTLSFNDYLTEELKPDVIINIMLGDLQRIKEYPTLGFQIAQEIPDAVWESFEYLVSLGYTKHLLKK